MADRIIDRLVSSLAVGTIGTQEFIQAVEYQASAIKPVAGAVGLAEDTAADPAQTPPLEGL
jgi:hypothetical protein